MESTPSWCVQRMTIKWLRRPDARERVSGVTQETTGKGYLHSADTLPRASTQSKSLGQ